MQTHFTTPSTSTQQEFSPEEFTFRVMSTDAHPWAKLVALAIHINLIPCEGVAEADLYISKFGLEVLTKIPRVDIDLHYETALRFFDEPTREKLRSAAGE